MQQLCEEICTNQVSGEPQSSFQVLAHEAKPVGKNSQLPFHSAGKEGLRVA